MLLWLRGFVSLGKTEEGPSGRDRINQIISDRIGSDRIRSDQTRSVGSKKKTRKKEHTHQPNLARPGRAPGDEPEPEALVLGDAMPAHSTGDRRRDGTGGFCLGSSCRWPRESRNSHQQEKRKHARLCATGGTVEPWAVEGGERRSCRGGGVCCCWCCCCCCYCGC